MSVTKRNDILKSKLITSVYLQSICTIIHVCMLSVEIRNRLFDFREAARTVQEIFTYKNEEVTTCYHIYSPVYILSTYIKMICLLTPIDSVQVFFIFFI